MAVDGGSSGEDFSRRVKALVDSGAVPTALLGDVLANMVMMEVARRLGIVDELGFLIEPPALLD